MQQQIVEAVGQAGRPRGSLTLRVRHESRAKIAEEAAKLGYSLSEMVERMIEARYAAASDPVLPRELRSAVIELGSAYYHGGPAAVVRRLLELAGPDEHARAACWHTMMSALEGSK